MVGLEDAREIADEYAKRTGSHWFEPDLMERDAYWVARVGFVGSMGVVIDKADGRVTVLGSAYSLADWLWGYEHGLLEVDGTLRVLAVHDEKEPQPADPFGCMKCSAISKTRARVMPSRCSRARGWSVGSSSTKGRCPTGRV